MEMRDIMSKIAILTDSSCDIPQELAEKYGIRYYELSHPAG